jgi:hypothetical protein
MKKPAGCELSPSDEGGVVDLSRSALEPPEYTSEYLYSAALLPPAGTMLA